MNLLANSVKARYVQARHISSEKTWPPPVSDSFIPLLLKKEKSTKSKTDEDNTGDLQDGHITKRLEDILESSDGKSRMILIEGAPGMGKTTLAKEIAYQWATLSLLQSFVLILLIHLRDPLFHRITFVSDLFKNFCLRDVRMEEIASACSNYFLLNNGRDLAIILDGFDELPENFQENSLIAEMLNRQVLPECTLIVTSCPHASLNLRNQVTTTVRILGFTKEEQDHYIHQALQGQPQKLKNSPHIASEIQTSLVSAFFLSTWLHCFSCIKNRVSPFQLMLLNCTNILCVLPYVVI